MTRIQHSGRGILRHLSVAALILLIPASVSMAEQGPRGWGVGLGAFDGDFGAHARKDFMLGAVDQFEIVVQGGLYNQNKWAGRFDGDFHYVFFPESAFRLYPLAGVDWAVQSKNNRAGANLGGGFTFDLNSQTRLFVEAKYVAGDWDGFAFTAGIYF